MIDQSLLTRVRNGIGAVGFMTVTDEVYRESPRDRNHFRIVGTGFLVRERTLITNEHVITSRNELLAKRRNDQDRKFVQFAYLDGTSLKITMVGEEFSSHLDDPALDTDIGFIDLGPNLPEQCVPLEICDHLNSTVTSQEVAMLGFPGSESLYVHQKKNIDSMIRVGPVLQQGHISAIAPLDGYQEIEYILSDIRTGPSMSGSPLFLPETGEVIGIHELGTQTTAFAIPLLTGTVDAFLGAHDAKRAQYLEPPIS